MIHDDRKRLHVLQKSLRKIQLISTNTYNMEGPPLHTNENASHFTSVGLTKAHPNYTRECTIRSVQIIAHDHHGL